MSSVVKLLLYKDHYRNKGLPSLFCVILCILCIWQKLIIPCLPYVCTCMMFLCCCILCRNKSIYNTYVWVGKYLFKYNLDMTESQWRWMSDSLKYYDNIFSKKNVRKLRLFIFPSYGQENDFPIYWKVYWILSWFVHTFL